MLSDEFKDLLKSTNSSYSLILIDILIALSLSIVVAIYKSEISSFNIKIILWITVTLLITQYVNHIYKSWINRKSKKKLKIDIEKNVLQRFTKDYGTVFNKIMNQEVRTTVFREELINKELFLTIASRFNSYPGDNWESKWTINLDTNIPCKGVAGAAWATMSVKKNAKLSGKSELKRLLRSENETDIKKLNSELLFLNMTIDELKVRLEKEDRNLMFPKMIFANAYKLPNGGRFVVVVDSDIRNTRFPGELKEQMDKFAYVLENLLIA